MTPLLSAIRYILSMSVELIDTHFPDQSRNLFAIVASLYIAMALLL